MELFSAGSIRQIAAEDSHVFAFRLSGKITDDDAEALAAFMNGVFDAADNVNMLMIFDGYEGTEWDGLFNEEVLKSRFRSLSKVDRYAVIGAPEGASKMVNMMGSVLPVESRAFDSADADDAWAFVGSRPAADVA